MILPKVRDSRFTLVRRGGSLSDADHCLLAAWAVACVGRVLPLFENSSLADDRPRRALEVVSDWARGEATVTEAKVAAYHANNAAMTTSGPAKYAAFAAGQAAAIAHVPAHYLGAAAYALRAATNPEAEREWQRGQLPPNLRDLILEDQRNRNSICWNVFFDEVP